MLYTTFTYEKLTMQVFYLYSASCFLTWLLDKAVEFQLQFLTIALFSLAKVILKIM